MGGGRLGEVGLWYQVDKHGRGYSLGLHQRQAKSYMQFFNIFVRSRWWR